MRFALGAAVALLIGIAIGQGVTAGDRYERLSWLERRELVRDLADVLDEECDCDCDHED
jgi:hypothetical protein